MLVELYKNKKVSDADSSSMTSKKDKVKGKANKPPSPPSFPS